MASLAPYQGVLGHRLAKHLLRRATFIQDKDSIDETAGKTAAQAVDDLFVVSDLVLPEPIDPDNGQHFINLGVEPSSPDFLLRRYIVAWWIEEARQDASITHKLEFFLHSIMITHTNSAQPRQNFDYLDLLRACASRYTNNGFEMDSFKNLALKIVTDNSMLRYLNGSQNTKNSPNENFAREFLELFTIGKGEQIGPGDYTNYTEADIVEAAKLLTGWIHRFRPLGTGGDPNHTDPDTGLQRGDPRYFQHDTTDKTFSSAFNDTVITGAVDEDDMWRELEEFVDMIFLQAATAKNICRKLYRYFVSRKISDEIETDIIDPLSVTLMDNDYKISIVLKELLKSEHFYDQDDNDANNEIIGSILKSPLEMLLQTMSFFGIEPPNYLTDSDNHYNRWYRFTVLDIITTQGGMSIYEPDSVAGYPAYYSDPDYSRNWFNGSTLISRYKQAEILLTGDRVLAGGNNGGVQLDIVDFIANSSIFSDPSDAALLVNEWLNYMFAETPEDDRATYYLDIFLDDLSPINWYFEWLNYEDTGDASAVAIPLQTLFKAITSSQEYGLK